MSRFKHVYLSQSGMAITQGLVVALVLSLVASFVMQLLVRQAESSKRYMAMSARSDLKKRLYAVTTDFAATANSANVSAHPVNASTNIGQCVNGGAGVCTAGVVRPFSLFDGTGMGTTAPGTLVASGTTPVFYDIFGKICTTPSASCVFQVSSTYVATCPGAAATCTQGNSVTISFTISQIPATEVMLGLRLKSTSPSTPAAIGLPLVAPPTSGGLNRAPVWATSSAFDFSPIVQDRSVLPVNTATIGELGAPSNLTVTGNMTVDSDFMSMGNLNLPNPISKIAVRSVAVVCCATTPTLIWGSVLARAMNSTIASAFNNMYAPAYNYTSDRRLKKDLALIQQADAKLNRLSGVSFRWRKNDEADLGFIAQDVEKVFPELVHDGKDGIKSVRYGNILPVVVEAFKERRAYQNEKFSFIESEIETLENEIFSQKGFQEIVFENKQFSDTINHDDEE